MTEEFAGPIVGDMQYPHPRDIYGPPHYPDLIPDTAPVGNDPRDLPEDEAPEQ